jgi:predicted RNA-binding protein with RPS1 domain
MRFEGKVKKIELFGAFVDIGAERNGLVHISQLRREGHVNRVADVVKEGDAVTVWVTSVDAKQGLVNLTMIEPPPLDWSDLQRGIKLVGKVVQVEDFGAFVSFGGPKDGLVPAGQMAKGRRINKPSDVVSVGESVTVWVVSVDRKRERIGLSMIEPPALPWAEVKKGHTYTGKVTRLERYGAFVDIGAEREDSFTSASWLRLCVILRDRDGGGKSKSPWWTWMPASARSLMGPICRPRSLEPEQTLMEQAFLQARSARPRRESVQNQLRGDKSRAREQGDILRRTLAQRPDSGRTGAHRLSGNCAAGSAGFYAQQRTKSSAVLFRYYQHSRSKTRPVACQVGLRLSCLLRRYQSSSSSSILIVELFILGSSSSHSSSSSSSSGPFRLPPLFVNTPNLLLPECVIGIPVQIGQSGPCCKARFQINASTYLQRMRHCRAPCRRFKGMMETKEKL